MAREIRIEQDDATPFSRKVNGFVFDGLAVGTGRPKFGLIKASGFRYRKNREANDGKRGKDLRDPKFIAV